MPELLAALPQPPLHIEMPQTEELLFTIAGTVPTVALVVLGIRHLSTGRGPLLLWCLLGGLLASLYEPFVDVMGLVYLPENGSMGTFTLLDREMPLFVPLIYPWYVGGLAYLTFRLLERGIDRKGLFKLWVAFAAVDWLLEVPAVVTDVYAYYGNAPFDVWGHPMWWGFMHSLVAIAGGAVIYALRHHLRGAAVALVAPILFMTDGAVNAGVGYPTHAALNADASYWATYPASLVTLGLGAIVIWLIGAVVGREPGTPVPDAAGVADPTTSAPPPVPTSVVDADRAPAGVSGD
ncbi:MAG: hypothetical protein M0P31_07355 [Solirubrobacteraceae bacterium]|nr:hypothetical protein [Solirubrobacteraceae bacterium]